MNGDPQEALSHSFSTKNSQSDQVLIRYRQTTKNQCHIPETLFICSRENLLTVTKWPFAHPWPRLKPAAERAGIAKHRVGARLAATRMVLSTADCQSQSNRPQHGPSALNALSLGRGGLATKCEAAQGADYPRRYHATAANYLLRRERIERTNVRLKNSSGHGFFCHVVERLAGAMRWHQIIELHGL